MAEPCGDKPVQEQGITLRGLWGAGGPPDQTRSPNQCGILQGGVQGAGVSSPAVSMVGNWGFVALFQRFRAGVCPVRPALLGEHQPEFQALGSACPTSRCCHRKWH